MHQWLATISYKRLRPPRTRVWEIVTVKGETEQQAKSNALIKAGFFGPLLQTITKPTVEVHMLD